MGFLFLWRLHQPLSWGSGLGLPSTLFGYAVSVALHPRAIRSQPLWGWRSGFSLGKGPHPPLPPSHHFSGAGVTVPSCNPQHGLSSDGGIHGDQVTWTAKAGRILQGRAVGPLALELAGEGNATMSILSQKLWGVILLPCCSRASVDRPKGASWRKRPGETGLCPM